MLLSILVVVAGLSAVGEPDPVTPAGQLAQAGDTTPDEAATPDATVTPEDPVTQDDPVAIVPVAAPPAERREESAQRLVDPAVASDPAPSKGLGFLITGGIMTGVGALNVAISPVCRADFYVRQVGEGGSDVCLYASLIVGGALVAVGVPLLVVGVGKRQKYNEWRERHPVAAGLGPTFGPNSVGVGWATEF